MLPDFDESSHTEATYKNTLTKKGARKPGERSLSTLCCGLHSIQLTSPSLVAAFSTGEVDMEHVRNCLGLAGAIFAFAPVSTSLSFLHKRCNSIRTLGLSMVHSKIQ